MEYKQFWDFSRVSLRIYTGFADETLGNQGYSANIRFSGGFAQGQLLDEKYLHLADLHLADLWDKLDVFYTWNLSSFIFVTLSFIFRMSRTFYCESLWLGMLTRDGRMTLWNLVRRGIGRPSQSGFSRNRFEKSYRVRLSDRPAFEWIRLCRLLDPHSVLCALPDPAQCCRLRVWYI